MISLITKLILSHRNAILTICQNRIIIYNINVKRSVIEVNEMKFDDF